MPERVWPNGSPSAGPASGPAAPDWSSSMAAARAVVAPHGRILSGAACCAVLECAFDLLRPWPLLIVVDNAVDRKPLRGVLTPLQGASPLMLAVFAALAGLLITALGALAGYGASLCGWIGSERIGADLRRAVVDRLLVLSPRFHDRNRTGDLVSRVTSDVGRVEDALVVWFDTVAPEGLTLIGMLVLLVLIDPVLALVGVAVTPVLLMVAIRRRRRVRAAQHAARTAAGDLAGRVNELLRHVRVVQAFGQFDSVHADFGKYNLAARDTGVNAAKVEARYAPAADLLLATGTALVLTLGVMRVQAGAITLGTLLVVLSYLSGLYGPIRSLARLATVIARGQASADRLMDILRADDIIRDDPHAPPVPLLAHCLQVDQVSFGYQPGVPVLRKLSFDVAAGETVCVVGATGTGKSTLLSLLVRLYDPDGGRIMIDGVDISRCSLASLRAQLALVPQDPWILDGTIAENIGFGQPGASREAVLAAGRLALVDEFIERLPRGWDSTVGESGVLLSGGQRQRIAIARAVLREARLLILDEPTSSLDPTSESYVLDALRRAARGRTVIVVTHRLSLAAGADRIIVLADGEVVEAGPPTDLLAAGGHYARLWAATGMAPTASPPVRPESQIWVT